MDLYSQHANTKKKETKLFRASKSKTFNPTKSPKKIISLINLPQRALVQAPTVDRG